MKKIVAVFLTVLLLAQPLCLSVFARFNDTELDWGDCVHEFDNRCDTTCNKCGITRTVPNHEATGFACAPTCAHCGVAMTPTTVHNYDNACDTDCNVCGAVREVGDHLFYIASVLPPTCGAEGIEYYRCEICAAHGESKPIPATGEHAYSNGCDDDCNECGFLRQVKGHVFDDDTDLICNQCGAVRVPDEDATPGDVNEDGAVNNKDLVVMMRQLGGWKVQINLAAADVNGDGVYSIKDVALLQRYLNGWDVEIV